MSAANVVIPSGLCQCGCGEKTRLGKEYGGKPRRFLKGHARKGQVLREKHWNWTGGRWVDSNGYVRVHVGLGHPMADVGGYVKEHRLVMSGLLGRHLSRNEQVHHLDGDRTNNSPDNLQLRVGAHGSGVVIVCDDCGSYNVRPEEI